MPIRNTEDSVPQLCYGRAVRPWSGIRADLPTVTAEEPLLSYIRRHLDAAGRLDPRDLDLPGPASLSSGQLRWAPGALDGTFGHHAKPDDSERRAPDVAEKLAKVCRRPTRRRLRSLHDALVEADALTIVDPLLQELIRLQPDVDKLRRIGLWLASTSPNRGPVKIGLAVLGLTGFEGHVDVIRTLGAHDEFTLYAATALRNGLEEPDSELWALAASVEGWGRIHCVELLRNTEDLQIRSWLLREGYQNSVMYEYTAFIAAETGGLLAALEQDPVDRTLLTAAGEILSALIEGGPAEDIDDYADGSDAIERYLTLMRSRAESLDDYLAVKAIRDFVSANERWEVDRPGWSVRRRDAFKAATLEILGQPHWHDRVAPLLKPDASESDFWRARVVARDLGVDTFEASFRRLQEDPLGSWWYDAWIDADTDRARRLAEVARARLPLAEIASGPGDELGLGPGWDAHSALDWSLQALGDHPGIGGDLLLVGLRSPVTRNRIMALKALQQWPIELWPSQARALVEATAATDPNKDTRELAGQVLRGEASD
jgi:hypothetical protein